MTNKQWQTIGCISITVLPLLACMTVWWGYPWIISVYYKDDIQAIEKRYEDYCTATETENWKIAYEYMSSSYKQTHNSQNFSTAPFENPCHGFGEIEIQLDSIKSGIIFYGDSSGLSYAGGEYPVVNENGNWYFTGDFYWYVD